MVLYGYSSVHRAFFQIENPTIRFGAELRNGNLTVRFGAVSGCCKSYGSVRFWKLENPTVRLGGLQKS